MLKHVAQTPLVLADLYEVHDLVSPVNDEMSHRSDENSASAKDKFSVMI